MEGTVTLNLDKLPIKHLSAIEESGVEHYPSEITNVEKHLSLIRRIDFSSVLEIDSNKNKKKKTDSTSTTRTTTTTATGQQATWQWQGLVENLQLAHQELSVILDLIATVETNDAVTVAGMQRPKQLPCEVLSDLAVSAATKLQRLRHLGKYFKQSSKALEQQVGREARFYGSLIRLQLNWKLKRQRVAAADPGNKGFTIDLLDSSCSNSSVSSFSSSLSTVRIDEDSAGILAVQLPLKSCRSLCLGFLGAIPSCKPRSFNKRNIHVSGENARNVEKEALTDDDVNECIKDTHSTLREVHQSIFQEQVFDMVNRETYTPSPGVNMTEIQEDFLQLAIGQDTSLCLCLVPSGKDDSGMSDSIGQNQNRESGISCHESFELMLADEKHDSHKKNLLGLPNPGSLEIYLQYIFHESILRKVKEMRSHLPHLQVSSHPAGDGSLLGHFCLTIAHRVFANKVLSELERLVGRVPYIHLLSHPTWHPRTSSWSLSLKMPQSVLSSGRQIKPPDNHKAKSGVRSQFHTKVVLNDDQISLSAEGVPNIISSFTGNSLDVLSINHYGCDLDDLPMILLQQVASQVIHWLHEEALAVGMKASRDFLCLYFTLDQGETFGLVAHIDPYDVQGCISWWVVLGQGSAEEGLFPVENGGSNYRRFLGHVSLEVLYSTLMGLVSFSCRSGKH